MALATLRHEERLGLVIALAAHAALVAWLVLKPPMPVPLPPVERTEVTLTDEVGLTATAPEPAAAPAAQVAPELGPVEPLPPMPVQRIVPLTPKPAPVAPSVTPRPAPKAAPPAARTAPPAPARRIIPRGARIGNDFLKGVNATAPGTAKTQTAATIGPQVRTSLAGAISRQLKPRWAAPQGVDADQLVTILAWDMNADGSLAGSPRVVRQEGITDANRAQAGRHAEQAVRAVRLAAPFNLPSEYYDAWKRVGSFRFDRKLSQ